MPDAMLRYRIRPSTTYSRWVIAQVAGPSAYGFRSSSQFQPGSSSERALDRGRPWTGPSVTRTCGRDVSITTLQPVDISECELCVLFGEDLLVLIRSQA
jgi:hypothetical protein